MCRIASFIQEVREVRQAAERLYGMRQPASGCEDDHARRLVNDGPHRGRAAPKIFYHLCVAGHGDDFTFAATESELRNMPSRMCIVRRQGALHCWQVALLHCW